MTGKRYPNFVKPLRFEAPLPFPDLSQIVFACEISGYICRGVTLISLTAACATTEDDQETQSVGVASDVDEPKTVFQDTTEIVVERIIEGRIVVGVIIDEENLMSPHDRQPGVAFVGEID